LISLIDGDLIAYRTAASCEKQGVVTEDFGIAQGRANNLIVSILEATSPERDHIIYLTGSDNFRKNINPQYKANRKDQKRPDYLEPLREWLVVNWGAEISDNCEADDMLAIEQTRRGDDSTIICTLDKDLRQVPGWHYSWEIHGTGSTGVKWTRVADKRYVSPREGLFAFYWQFIMGDQADNLFGFDGKARAKIPKFLQPMYDEMADMSTEQELFDFVREQYNNDERLIMNGQCFWMQRTEGEDWSQRGKQLLELSGTGDNGPKDDTEVS